MAAGSFPTGFRVRLHAKDLRICQAMAQHAGVKLPVIEETLGDYAQLIGEGHGEEDISAVFRLKRALFDKASGG
jgi:3-hydroxyisobutyrate dehydrogenase